jgi:hypothetical protein
MLQVEGFIAKQEVFLSSKEARLDLKKILPTI